MPESRTSQKSLDDLCINTIRFLAVDAVEKAKSGHPGMPMGAAPLAYVLWTKFLRHNPANPDWFDRDRFVLSAGHGSMLLYSLLHLTGYDLSLDDIKSFRQWGSRTPGHPERGVTPGVEVTTGPLGQGFANAVGMALVAAHLAAVYNRPGFPVVNHHTWCVAGDGDLMEGVAAEACSLAGHLRLGNLICLYDDNRVTLAASTDLSFTEDRLARFVACGWHVETVADGNDVGALETAIAAARAETTRPSLIAVRTRIGYGSPRLEGRFEAHGAPLGAEEVRVTKERLGWPTEPLFFIPPEALGIFREASETGSEAEASWRQNVAAYAEAYPELAADFMRRMRGDLPVGWSDGLPSFPADGKGMATRVASGKVMNAVASRLPELVGGSADLNPSTHTFLRGFGDSESPLVVPADRQGAVGEEWGYAGRNVHFGVREHCMAAAMNGMAAHGGVIPFGATFLAFSDYLRPALRLAAIMELHLVHVFTHDSLAVGEDGPTHQPVEQIAALRAIPNLVVIRPADANETAVAWQVALERRQGPTALILSRQNLPVLDRSRAASAEGGRRGAYVLSDTEGLPEVILIATGSEVALAVAAAEVLEGEGAKVRVVSFPSWELFEEQSREYRDAVLPPQVKKRVVVEAATSFGWERYAGDSGIIVGVDRFGASAPGEVLLREFGFSTEHVCRLVRQLLS